MISTKLVSQAHWTSHPRQQPAFVQKPPPPQQVQSLFFIIFTKIVSVDPAHVVWCYWMWYVTVGHFFKDEKQETNILWVFFIGRGE